MGAGLGILLLVIGAILSFTTIDNQLVNTNLDVVGYILMAGGALALIVALVMNRQRANTSHTAVVERRNLEQGHIEHVERHEDPRV